MLINVLIKEVLIKNVLIGGMYVRGGAEGGVESN